MAVCQVSVNTEISHFIDLLCHRTFLGETRASVGNVGISSPSDPRECKVGLRLSDGIAFSHRGQPASVGACVRSHSSGEERSGGDGTDGLSLELHQRTLQTRKGLDNQRGTDNRCQTVVH